MNVSIYKILGENWVEELSEIREGFHETAQLVSDEISHKDGWHIYSNLIFDLEGKRYVISYHEHSSDNVCDFNWDEDSLICIGDSEESEKLIKKSQLEILKASYEQALKGKEEEIKELKKKEKLAKEVFSHLDKYSKDFIDTLGQSLIRAYPEENDVTSEALRNVGGVLIDYSKLN